MTAAARQGGAMGLLASGGVVVDHADVVVEALAALRRNRGLVHVLDTGVAVVVPVAIGELGLAPWATSVSLRSRAPVAVRSLPSGGSPGALGSSMAVGSAWMTANGTVSSST